MERLGRRIGARRQRRAITLGLAFLVFLVTALPAASSFWALRSVDRLSGSIDALLTTSQQIQNLMVDQETAQRGYLLTGNAAFLQPYAAGHTALTLLWPKASAQAAQVGGQAPALLAAVQRAATDWQTQYGDREVDLMQAGRRAAAIASVASGGGKAQFDAFRAQSSALTNYVDSLRKLELDQEAARSLWLTRLLVLAGVLDLAALGLVWYLNRLAYVTEAKAAREADLRLLADASDALAASLDYHATLLTVARLAVPDLADSCLVDITRPNGVSDRLAFALGDAAPRTLPQKGTDQAASREKDAPLLQAMASGEPLVLDHAATLLSLFTEETEPEALFPQHTNPSALIVPLKARGRVLGTYTLLAATGRPPFRDAERALAQELAGRCAMAIDNALLLRDAQAATQARVIERDRLQQVLNVLPEGVLIADSAGAFVMGNAAATELLGRDVVGHPMAMAGLNAYRDFGARRIDGTPYPAEELPLERAVLRGEAIQGDQFLLRNARTGRDVPVLANSVPLRDAAGALQGGIVVFQDISALKELDRQKDDFLNAMSHDLRNPLTVIKGTLQVQGRRLQRQGSLEPTQVTGALATINTATEQLLGMVEALLDSTRLQLGRALDLQRQPADLVQLTQRVASQHQQLSDTHRIVVQSSETPIIGNWDATRIERILGNLIGNALKYSPDGGDMTLSLTTQADDTGRWAILSIRDQGIGILEADLPHIFDRFHRSSNVRGRIAGSGIGLHGARQIAEEHGGTLTAASVEGAGSVFTLRLPLDGAP